MYGWIGKVLRVNLTKGECTSEDLDLGLARKFIGGRGLAIQSKEHRAIQKLNEGGKRGTRQG